MGPELWPRKNPPKKKKVSQKKQKKKAKKTKSSVEKRTQSTIRLKMRLKRSSSIVVSTQSSTGQPTLSTKPISLCCTPSGKQSFTTNIPNEQMSEAKPTIFSVRFSARSHKYRQQKKKKKKKFEVLFPVDVAKMFCFRTNDGVIGCLQRFVIGISNIGAR